MNNTPLGSMVFGFDHTLTFFLDMLTAKYRMYSWVKCPLFVAGDALKGRFIRRHEHFSSHQHSREDIPKQVGGIYSSYVESGEVWRQQVDLVCSAPSAGCVGYI